MRKSIERIKEEAEKYYKEGVALMNLGKYEGAVQSFDSAITLKSDEVIYYCAKGNLLNKLGREQEALERFNKAYRLSETGELGINLDGSNITYINSILSEDRKKLLEKLTRL